MCNKCKTNFKIKEKIEDIDKDLKLHYFVCSKCSKRYAIKHSNTITRELQSKLTQADISSKSALYKQYKEEFTKING